MENPKVTIKNNVESRLPLLTFHEMTEVYGVYRPENYDYTYIVNSKLGLFFVDSEGIDILDQAVWQDVRFVRANKTITVEFW